jgi:hypothetical protein
LDPFSTTEKSRKLKSYPYAVNVIQDRSIYKNRLDTRHAPQFKGGNDAQETVRISRVEKQGTIPGKPAANVPGAKRRLSLRLLRKALVVVANTEILGDVKLIAACAVATGDAKMRPTSLGDYSERRQQ